MIKLLIVDDEKNIRIGLKTMIEREFPGLYQVMTATQGAEALELYRSEGADVVITDIRMPVMDGITLIEKMSGTSGPDDPGHRPIVIILSGYEDFEYAKAAIRYQVMDYLLKPIRRDELFAALRKSEEDLKKRSQLAEQIATTEAYRIQLQSRRLQEFLLQPEITEEEAAKLGEEIGFEGYSLPFSVAVLSYRYEDGRRMNRDELKSLAEHMLSSVQGHLNASLLDSEGRVVLIGGPQRKFAELSQLAAEKDLGGLLMGISEEGNRQEDIAKCYANARTSLEYTFIFPKTRLIWYSELQAKRVMFPVPEEDIRKLGNILGTNRGREVGALLHDIFRIEVLPGIDIAYLEAVSRRINEQVLDEVFRVYGEASIEVLKLYRKVGTMTNFRHFHDYYRSLEQLLLGLDEYIKGIRSAHSEHGDMREAVAYIEENYHRALNMAMVSNYVSLNYSYFSEAFKAYTGESFVLYLKKVRIRKAKEMIGTDTLKLSEIGAAVGFENTKQFSRVFKELEGISPFEYRGKLFAGHERLAGSGRANHEELE
ncbi:two-component system response regulator YesN [Fontibacillus phaseoli]|uniref:Two-component system response regulator YesN n=1 Tax=Fontibacillus phaseoli TaxID=1416533 RepID=A0A369B9Y4_9BACL|nr:response regulator [Fontibacillus phaseoli]RCX18211.1 two-component system response regulator YesN [Fontibacillus phaseoli]